MVNTPRIPPLDLGKILSVFNTSAQNQVITFPRALLQLPVQTLIQALVVANDPQGNLVLQTPQGNVAVKTPLPLPQGATVQLQVVNTGSQFQFHLVTVNGKPAADVFPQAQGGASSTAKQAQSFLFKPVPNAAQPPAGQNISTPVRVEAPFNTPSLPLLQGTVISLKTDVLQVLVRPFTLQPGTGALVPAASSTTPSPGAPPVLQPGQPIGVRILVSTPPTPLNAPLAPTPSTVVLPHTSVAFPEGTGVAQNTPVFPPGKFPYANPPLPTVLPSPSEPALLPPAPPPGRQSQPNQGALPIPPQSAALPGAASPAPQTALPHPVPLTQPATLQTTPVQQAFPITTMALPGGTPANNSAPPVANNQPLPQVTGQVIGHEPSGETLVQTPVGTVKLATTAPFPKGTQLTLELVALPPSPAAAASFKAVYPTVEEEGIPQLLKAWKTLEEVIKSPEGQESKGRYAPLQGRVPVPDKNLGGRILHFMAAVQSGDIEQWLGSETLQALRQGESRPLVEQLAKEFATFHKLFTEPTQTTWQGLAFPVYDGQTLQQGRLFVRYQEEGEGSGAERQAAHTRFIVEVDLQKLGAMQLDGLVSQGQPSKRFDLIIRSQLPLDAEAQQDIRQIFTLSQEMTGFKGKVSFENAYPFPIQPSQEVVQGQGYGDSASSLMV